MQFFLFLEAKKAVEVIEASEAIMSVEIIEALVIFRTTYDLEINKLIPRITYFFFNGGCGGQGCYFLLCLSVTM